LKKNSGALPTASSLSSPVRVWRVCRKEHVAFDGQGGRITSGRWHHRGSPVVYTAGSLALAALEFFVHIPAGINLAEFVAVSADIPDRLKVENLSPAELPEAWRNPYHIEDLRDAGTEWLLSRRTVALAVPSAVIPIENNYLLNPLHKDFARIRVHPPEPFEFDYRMWK